MRVAKYLLGMLSGLWLSCAVQAVDQQTVTVTSVVGGASCDVSVNPTTLNFVGLKSDMTGVAWRASGGVEHFTVNIENCINAGTGDSQLDLAPSIQFSGSYNVGSNCGNQTSYDCLWRDNEKSQAKVGFLLAPGNYSGDQNAFYQQNQTQLIAAGSLAIASRGVSQGNTQKPFSMVMTCGLCTDVVDELGDEASATMTISFAYQ